MTDLKRCIFAPVEIDGEEISSLRRRFDPLYDKCPPHITLVFPFSSPNPVAELAGALEDIAKEHRRLAVELASPVSMDRNVMLPVVDAQWLPSAHRRLSRLVGTGDREPYSPHVTIGRGLDSVPGEMMNLPTTVQARVERLILEEIQKDDSSLILHEVLLR